MTALSHVFGLFNIDECKVYAVTADPAGGTTTYGAAISVPGIRTINVQPDMLSKELYGDAQVLSTKSRVRAIKATVEHARLNLDALSLMLGSTVADTGTTPSRVSTLTDGGSTVVPGSFKLEARVLGVDGEAVAGDFHITLYKCTADTVALGGAQEDWAIPSFSITAVSRYSDGKRMLLGLNETATALSA